MGEWMLKNRRKGKAGEVHKDNKKALLLLL